MTERPGNPFSSRAALALILFGAGVFVLLLWMIGAGQMQGGTNDGGGHAGGKGLNGYAALASLMERRGFTVEQTRTEAALEQPGLLVLTPPHDADGDDIARIVQQRRYAGPTLVVTPKWLATPLPTGTPNAKRGWVQLGGARPPDWPGFLHEVGLSIAPAMKAQWFAHGLSGPLPDGKAVLSGTGAALVPLVMGRTDGRVLAAYIADDGIHPALERLALEAPRRLGENEDLYPLVVVFEPDLLNNYGLANAANAQLAERLIRAAAEDGGETIRFDLTLNGLTRSPNLLTLAFTPPFLAATLCLLLAALAIGWRAFRRFGPPRVPPRAIAFGKRALVANTAGLIRRSGRLHLVAAPYAAHARERIARALHLPRTTDAAATDAAIDRALAARTPDAPLFSTTVARLLSARHGHDLLRAAQDLHALERTLAP